MNKTTQDIKAKLNRYQFWAIVVLCFGVILLVYAPFLFTQYHTGIVFTGTGEIGDTIGGTTAPIASLIGSILVFLAFLSQIDANKLLITQVEKQEEDRYLQKNFEIISSLINVINESINNFKYRKEILIYPPGMGFPIRGSGKTEFLSVSGSEAIAEVLEKYYLKLPNTSMQDINSNPNFAEVFYLLGLIINALNRIDSLPLEKSDDITLKFILSHIFFSKIEPAFAYAEVNTGRHRKNFTEDLLIKNIETITAFFNKDVPSPTDFDRLSSYRRR